MSERDLLGELNAPDAFGYAKYVGGPLGGGISACRVLDVWNDYERYAGWTGRYELDRDALEYRWVPDATDRSEPS